VSGCRGVREKSLKAHLVLSNCQRGNNRQQQRGDAFEHRTLVVVGLRCRLALIVSGIDLARMRVVQGLAFQSDGLCVARIVMAFQPTRERRPITDEEQIAGASSAAVRAL
jgi:hypothetical protein